MVVDCQKAIARLSAGLLALVGSAGLLALVVVVGAGCGGPNCPDPDNDECPQAPNQCPRILGLIPDDTLEVEESRRLNVKDFFQDPDTADRDRLVYTAKSEDESKVGVEMSGAVLTYTAVAPGESEISVLAADEYDSCDVAKRTQEFTVTVNFPNRPPQCAFDFPPVDTLPIGITGREKGLFCSDEDDFEDLTISVESSDPDVLSVSYRGGEEFVTFSTVSLGTATVTATATDTEGLTGEGTFVVTVVEEL